MSQMQTYLVRGMTCGHCVGAVTSELHTLGTVTDVAYRDRRGRLGRFSAVLVRLPEGREITIGPLRERSAVAMYIAIDAHRPHAPLPG